MLRVSRVETIALLCLDLRVSGEDDIGELSSDCSAPCSRTLEVSAKLALTLLLCPLPGAPTGLSSISSTITSDTPVLVVDSTLVGWGRLSSSSGSCSDEGTTPLAVCGSDGLDLVTATGLSALLGSRFAPSGLDGALSLDIALSPAADALDVPGRLYGSRVRGDRLGSAAVAPSLTGADAPPETLRFFGGELEGAGAAAKAAISRLNDSSPMLTRL